MKTVIDIILLAIIIASIWAGYKKGLVMGIGGMIVIIVSLYGSCLISTAFSYDIVPALRPFASGYIERQMQDNVLEAMGLSNTQLSPEDILASDPQLRHSFCVESFRTVGIYTDAAEQMATEAENYADTQDASVQEAVIEVLCARVTYVAGVVLVFLVLLISLTAIGNIPNLSFRIPNMDILNDAGGAVMGLLTGVTYCVLLCWALRFLGLFIGRDTLDSAILCRFFLNIDFITSGVGI